MGLSLSPFDALRYDFQAIAADEQRSARMVGRIMRATKRAADAFSAEMLKAIYLEK